MKLKLVLDTHIFLWLINDDSRLEQQFKIVIENPDNEVFLNVVSIW